MMRGPTELGVFINALREVLGLDPLPLDGTSAKPRPDIERFYIVPYAFPWDEATPKVRRSA